MPVGMLQEHCCMAKLSGAKLFMDIVCSKDVVK